MDPNLSHHAGLLRADAIHEGIKLMEQVITVGEVFWTFMGICAVLGGIAIFIAILAVVASGFDH
jgi:hypothetical protein